MFHARARPSLQPPNDSRSIHPSLSLFDQDTFSSPTSPTSAFSSSSSSSSRSFTFPTSTCSSRRPRLSHRTSSTPSPSTSSDEVMRRPALDRKETLSPPVPASIPLPPLPTFTATRSLPRFPCPVVDNWGDELRKRERERASASASARRDRRRRRARGDGADALGRNGDEEDDDDDRWEVASDVTVTAEDLVARAATRAERDLNLVDDDDDDQEDGGGATPTQEFKKELQ
ncbi:hypothetical protein JCM11491_002004 [Sporobolomyces phaffii]